MKKTTNEKKNRKTPTICFCHLYLLEGTDVSNNVQSPHCFISFHLEGTLTLYPLPVPLTSRETQEPPTNISKHEAQGRLLLHCLYCCKCLLFSKDNNNSLCFHLICWLFQTQFLVALIERPLTAEVMNCSKSPSRLPVRLTYWSISVQLSLHLAIPHTFSVK